ncbi:MAG: hypothetical protein P8010_00865 [Desulfosarcinaceae bacterium]
MSRPNHHRFAQGRHPRSAEDPASTLRQELRTASQKILARSMAEERGRRGLNG